MIYLDPSMPRYRCNITPKDVYVHLPFKARGLMVYDVIGPVD